MDNSGLLFIPDISGFTKFVNETDIEHSRYIISELLERIINSNQIGLNISEIEGDAVLFYRFGKTPSLPEIYQQVEKMFCNFQKQLKTYETLRACQCSACVSAVNLSLKVITHFGEFSTYNVQKYSKLIGKDVIVAHQLLKNDISLHEYWLATGDLFNEKMAMDLPAWMSWEKGNKQTDKGEILFHYSMLTYLKDKVQPDEIYDYSLGDNKVKMISHSKTIDAPSLNVLSAIGNFSQRTKWMEGVTSIDQISHPINHMGVKHRAVFNNRPIIFYSSSFAQNDGAFSYSETDAKKTMSFEFTLEPITGNQTSVVIDYYVKKHPLSQFFFPLFSKNKLSQQLAKSLDNLEALCLQPESGYIKAGEKTA